jgi:hypothetical protein
MHAMCPQFHKRAKHVLIVFVVVVAESVDSRSLVADRQWRLPERQQFWLSQQYDSPPVCTGSFFELFNFNHDCGTDCILGGEVNLTGKSELVSW